MAGLHSGETGPPEMLMELAYRLVASDTPLIRQIRDRIIVSFTPASDPDGRDRYIDWYRKYMVDITEEKDRITGPPYWGKYIFHDNNRDINYSQVTMRAHLEWYLKTHPPVVHDLHESVPFLYTFSGQAPQNPNLDPIVYGELPTFANFEMTQLTKYGMPGVWTHGFVDMWSPGYLAFMSSNHNGLVRMYETFGNGGATTMKRRVAPPEGAGQTSREWYRPMPPYREVVWSMRNNTNYMQTAVLSALQYAASFPDVVVENFYRKSRNGIEAGRKDAPYAFVVPAGQKDQTRVDLLLSLLQRQGIEIAKLSSEVKLSDGTYPAGSYVIRRDQPYGRLAKTLLEKQTFPDPSLRTYDDTGWTMGLMLQVDVKPTADKAIFEAPVTRVTDLLANAASSTAPRRRPGGSSRTTVRTTWSALRLALGTDGRRARRQRLVQGRRCGVSRRVVPGARQRRRDVHGRREAARPRGDRPGVDAGGRDGARGPAAPRDVHDVGPHAGGRLGAPRVRHVRHPLRPDLQGAHPAGHAARGLRRHPDPEPGDDGQVAGVRRAAQGRRRWRIARTRSIPTLGTYGETDDVTGGMGLEGVLELQKFVDEGGVLITLGASSYMPAEFGLQREVTATRPTGAFYAPGPIVQAEILRPEHPIFFGYDKKTVPVRYANGPLFQVPLEDVPDQVLMRFTGGDERRAERTHARRRGNPPPAGGRRYPGRQGPRRRLRHQPLLPVAEPRRVRDALQRGGALLERRAGEEARRRGHRNSRAAGREGSPLAERAASDASALRHGYDRTGRRGVPPILARLWLPACRTGARLIRHGQEERCPYPTESDQARARRRDPAVGRSNCSTPGSPTSSTWSCRPSRPTGT